MNAYSSDRLHRRAGDTQHEGETCRLNEFVRDSKRNIELMASSLFGSRHHTPAPVIIHLVLHFVHNKPDQIENMHKKVFILGATGFIGQGVARAFVRHGYVVSGLARSQDKAKLLESIGAIVGTVKDTASWSKQAEEADIIVDAVADYADRSTPSIIANQLVPLLQQKPQLSVVYTSGIWVYGPDRGTPFEESHPLQPFPNVAWRPAHEKNLTDVGAIVIRPAVLYGATGSLTGNIFADVKNRGKTVVGVNQIWPTVHVDDLGEAYVLAVEKGNRGQVYNVSNEPISLNQTLQKLQSHVKFEFEEQLAPADNGFLTALRSSQNISSKKAREELGWVPKRAPLDEGIISYYQTWESLTA
ncbi:hypothetical protein PROFUN_12234 [Planoprotostelium fungivorum]|uniref:NAD-dependent epimerase/dehydratase domain-containing protein n=1 Tax=Planoprotostelium fungivorum TaxID=1890364 RepID=A0A2P6N880_9EUKA|nr:hypothetical protein PROFUN_12234 [Planoprotostelium fungivorum]